MMLFSKQIASQLINPSGFFGRFALPRIWNRGNRILNDLVFEQLNLQQDDTILEVGFGGGYLLDRLYPFVNQGMTVGVDLSPVMIAHFIKRHRSLFKETRLFIGRVRAEALPFVSGSFSKVCTINTVFFFKDPQQVFFEQYRILTKNGIAVICFTDRESLESRSFSKHGLRLFTSEEVKQIMVSAGFKHIRMIHAKEGKRGFYCFSGRKL